MNVCQFFMYQIFIAFAIQILDDPFTPSEYANFGRHQKNRNKFKAKEKHTRSVEVLRRSKQNFNAANGKVRNRKTNFIQVVCDDFYYCSQEPTAALVGQLKYPPQALKLKPVQPRKRKRVPSKDNDGIFSPSVRRIHFIGS